MAFLSPPSYKSTWLTPFTIYSSLLSGFLSFLFESLSLSADTLLEFKNEGYKDDVEKKKANEIKYLKLKSILFLVIGIILLFFFWYYLSCFNNVYSNTKIEWLKSSVFIIIIMQLIPFFSSLIFALLRFISLRCQIEQIYKIINAYG